MKIRKSKGTKTNASTRSRRRPVKASKEDGMSGYEFAKQFDTIEEKVSVLLLDAIKKAYHMNGQNFDDLTDAEKMEAVNKLIGKIESSTRSTGSSIKAATDEYMLSEVIGEKDTIIDEWSSEYDGEPSTSWDTIFDNVVNDFELYCDDEASSYGEDRTLKEKFDAGVLSESDMLTEFYDFIRFIDISDYDN